MKIQKQQTESLYQNIAKNDKSAGARWQPAQSGAKKIDKINGVKFTPQENEQKQLAGGQGNQPGIVPPLPGSPPATGSQFNPNFMRSMPTIMPWQSPAPNPNGGINPGGMYSPTLPPNGGFNPQLPPSMPGQFQLPMPPPMGYNGPTQMTQSGVMPPPQLPMPIQPRVMAPNMAQMQRRNLNQNEW